MRESRSASASVWSARRNRQKYPQCRTGRIWFPSASHAHGDGSGCAAIVRPLGHGRKLGLCLPQAVEILQGLRVAHADGFRVQTFIACELDNESFAEGHRENRIN